MCVLEASDSEFWVENCDSVAHDVLVAFLREKIPHGILPLVLREREGERGRERGRVNKERGREVERERGREGERERGREGGRKTLSLKALLCSSSVMHLILFMESNCTHTTTSRELQLYKYYYGNWQPSIRRVHLLTTLP